MSEKLKPCPFCGSQAQIIKINAEYYVITCTKNCVETEISTKEKAIEIWNRRAIV